MVRRFDRVCVSETKRAEKKPRRNRIRGKEKELRNDLKGRDRQTKKMHIQPAMRKKKTQKSPQRNHRS